MNIFKILMALHIAGGGLSLLLGGYIMLTKKGGRIHKLLGNIYFYAMLLASMMALPMACMHPNYFLFIIGIFTSYMLISGKRYLTIRKLSDVKKMDWFLAVVMLVFGFLFIALGIYNIVSGNYFGTVFLVFGAISILFVYQDYQNFKGKSNIRNFWLTTHLQRMTGSYIASATAFLVVNNKILPGILVWLLPTIVIVPLIIRWTRKYKTIKAIIYNNR